MRTIELAQEFFLGYNGYAILVLKYHFNLLLIGRGWTKIPDVLEVRIARCDLSPANQMLSNDTCIQNWFNLRARRSVWDINFVDVDLARFAWLWGQQGQQQVLGLRLQLRQEWLWNQELALEFPPTSHNFLGRAALVCDSGSHCWRLK